MSTRFDVSVHPNHSVLTAPEFISDAVAVEGGVIFTQADALWRLNRDDSEPQKLVASPSPHSVAADGTWLYWLSDAPNERLNLETLAREPFVQIAAPAKQHRLSIGRHPYALADHGLVYWVRNNAAYVVIRPTSSDGRLGPLALRAGGNVVALSMVDPNGAPYLKRARDGTDKDNVESSSTVAQRFSLNDEGELLFLRGDQVMRLSPDTDVPQHLFSASDLSGLCWCGANICTVSAETRTLQRYLGRLGTQEQTPEVLSKAPSSIQVLSCRDDTIVWTTPSPRPTTLQATWLEQVGDE
jgi:hypothetical protein